MGITKSNSFEDLQVWQKSYQLSIDIYRAFQNIKDFNFRSHIFKTAISIPSNVAEGFERRHNKEFIQFLNIAKGSGGELRTQLFVALDLSFIDQEKANDFINRSKEVSSMLSGLIKSRKGFEKKKIR